MMPNKILITIVGVAMIGLILYPPMHIVVPQGGGYVSVFAGHYFLWSSDYGVARPDVSKLCLYELALAGVGALIHFVTRK